jgi:Raf kinase inhibitor-like YbhB/YbcL family protein
MVCTDCMAVCSGVAHRRNPLREKPMRDHGRFYPSAAAAASLALAVLAWTVLAGCDGRTSSPYVDGRRPAMLTVRSSAFEAGARIPKKYTGEGENVSPPLTWSDVPGGVVEQALICDDPDAPTDEPWVHWVLFKIPVAVTSLDEGDNAGAREGRNSNGNSGYTGPMPPAGHGVHHYHFKVYALDVAIDLAPGATKNQLVEAMKGHILAEGELVGTYER